MSLLWNTLPTDVGSFGHPPVALAAESKVVGALKGSGLVFKDTLQIERFEDPKVKGVVLYISNFERPITEKLSGKNFFNDPSSAGVACARTGPTAVADNIARGPGTCILNRFAATKENHFQNMESTLVGLEN